MTALVEGSDPKSITDIGKGDKCTYLKIGEYSYSAIKLLCKITEIELVKMFQRTNTGL